MGTCHSLPATLVCRRTKTQQFQMAFVYRYVSDVYIKTKSYEQTDTRP